MGMPEMFAVGTADTARESSWLVPSGIRVRRSSMYAGPARPALAALEERLDRRRGLLAHIGDGTVVGYADPPIEVTARGSRLAVRALNARGRVLLPALSRATAGLLHDREVRADGVYGIVPSPDEATAEEDRTRRAGVFTVLRALVDTMRSPADPCLGLYGAFGYDLILGIEGITVAHQRDPADRVLVLHLPDEVLVVDARNGSAIRHRYEFQDGRAHTDGLPRTTPDAAFRPGGPVAEDDHAPGEYARVVERARAAFHAGDLFEVVPGREFRRPATAPPSAVYRRLYARNPAPYALLMNLGEREHLIGASPERFVAVHEGGDTAHGRHLVVESAPISGTIARGRDALEDAVRVRRLLESEKEESELTMCTDVDRNDKAKVCVPGSIRVTARRRVEFHATLIHTVDRVEGRLRPELDALDAFLAHLWAVTVTGAPKRAAVQYLERAERSPRRWYGGAVGRIRFDGGLDTALTLRTIQIRRGTAVVRTGATLLCASDPRAEEAETELKARALLAVLDEERPEVPDGERTLEARLPAAVPVPPAPRPRVLMVDHQDSFVHCLADYFRQCGADVATFRPPHHLAVLERTRPDLLVLSPGPGRPGDFGIGETLAAAEAFDTPVFGVCLGLQGLVEYLGGTLDVLDRPAHGRSSRVRVTDPGSRLLAGLPDTFEVGRYHSLYAAARNPPPRLRVCATTDDGIAMVVEHTERPLAAVQFHPESIMTAQAAVGRTVIANALTHLARRPNRATAPTAPTPIRIRPTG
ncbi:anthranilate synthase component I [Embleya hyalina]|uniref:Anthranilate synthase component I n=1 Tax=Embleya hyalina TaxID=516124 RepID=A0A401YMA4_9ACTN|nr:anthranilate synthase component I [Embleya hyalina]GCD95736.1 anthranilate synthase component I [Embleya hyalina]